MIAMEQTLHVNPTREDRKRTNTPFVWIFGLIIFVWLIVVIKALVGVPSQEVYQNTQPTFPTIEDVSPQDFDTNYQTTYSTMEYKSSRKSDENYQTDYSTIKSVPSEVVDKDDQIMFHAVGDESSSNVEDDYRMISLITKAMTFNFTGIFLMLAVLSGAIAVGYIYFLTLPQGKFAIHGAMGLLCCWIVIYTLSTLLASLLLLFNILAIVLVLPIFIYAAYLVTSFLCACGAGVDAIFEIIRDSSRALICSPMVLLLVLAVSIIIVSILIFFVHVSNCILLSKSGIYFYVGLNFFGAKTLINFFVNLIHMVISEYAVDWFWTKDHHSSSSFTILRSLSKTFSYHLGTVAFASIPLLSFMASIFQVSKCRDSDKDIIKIYNVYTRFFSQLSVTFYVTDYALVQTSIYGYDYGTAIMAAHDIVAQNNHELNLAVSEMAIVLTSIGSFFITLPFTYVFIQYSLYSPFIPFAIAFTSAVHALLVNKMIIKYTSDALQEDCESAEKAISPEAPVDV